MNAIYSPGEPLIAAIDLWIKALDDYSFGQLTFKPSPGSWSMGQVYKHLITNTRFFLEQGELCLQSGDNESEAHSAEAAKMFSENSFPDLRLEGPPSNADTQQPLTKDELVKEMEEVRKLASVIISQVSVNTGRGKTRHPDLGFFNANEWMQFAEMHLRHHLRQKQRVDQFLDDNKEMLT